MARYDHYIDIMIQTIKAKGIHNRNILQAMKNIPRHKFLPHGFPLDEAYKDKPLMIGEGQSISQPYSVAFMLNLLDLNKGQRVLEIGTGSGWSSALIKELVGDSGLVVSMELLAPLAEIAHERMRNYGIDVLVVEGDGALGYENLMPYDRIILACAPLKIHDIWIKELKLGGILLVPVGRFVQTLIKGIKRSQGLKISKHGSHSFVPLISDLDGE